MYADNKVNRESSTVPSNTNKNQSTTKVANTKAPITKATTTKPVNAVKNQPSTTAKKQAATTTPRSTTRGSKIKNQLLISLTVTVLMIFFFR